jgi:Uma2 family endonuclease
MTTLIEDRKAEQRLLLNAVSWQEYTDLGQILRDRPALRLTYDRGRLELMTTSPEHERLKKRLSRLIETLAEEFGLQIETAGNMTFARADLERALEPDDCFWIAHEAQMRTREEWDPKEDPPPDLALEIEISRSAVNRMDLYAALGVPEVWRCDGESLRVHLLQPDRTYQSSEASPTFPGIPMAEMIVFLQPNETMCYLDMVRAFREWVRRFLQEGRED